jgi:hypothetical protein
MLKRVPTMQTQVYDFDHCECGWQDFRFPRLLHLTAPRKCFSVRFPHNERWTQVPVTDSTLRPHIKNAHFSGFVFMARHRKVVAIQLGH